jgi:hypothetical protein
MKLAGVGSIGRNINGLHIIGTVVESNPRARNYFGTSETPFASAMKSDNIGT